LPTRAGNRAAPRLAAGDLPLGPAGGLPGVLVVEREGAPEGQVEAYAINAMLDEAVNRAVPHVRFIAALAWLMLALALGLSGVWSLGAGMALPWLVIALFPALAHSLPRPGPWMERFKQLLAFPLYATAACLLWVLSRQVDARGLALPLLARGIDAEESMISPVGGAVAGAVPGYPMMPRVSTPCVRAARRCWSISPPPGASPDR